jgi:dTMP kinase
MHLDTFCCRGPLVSVEGIRGVGKTYLTQMLAASLAKQEAAPVVTEDFSARQQPGRRDLGRDLLKVLTSASGGDRFLRGGYPAAVCPPATARMEYSARTAESCHRVRHSWRALR